MASATRVARVGGKPARSSAASEDRLLTVLFVAPTVILVAVLMYYPMLRTLQQSFYEFSMLQPIPRFVGFEQYQDLFRARAFGDVLRNSILWTLIVVLFQNVIGMAVAVLLNQNLPAKGLTRAIVLLPWVLPGIVNAILWRFMYDPQLGLINSVLISMGLTDERIPWLASSSTAMVALIISAIWKGFPFSTVIYLSALQGVDKEQMEAAEIDGANAWQRFRFVVLPSVSGIVRLNLLLTTIWTFNYFDLIWVTTKGGPGNSTHIFPTIIYEVGFGQFNFGQASVYGVIAVAVLSVFTFLYLREMRRIRAI
jgi:multiple sugar transport system permease protein